MAKKNNQKCLGCGGDLIFSPEKQALFCKNCKSLQNINAKNEFIKIDYNEENIEDVKPITKSCNCPNCGANIDTQNGEISKICPYCENSFVLSLNEINGLKPNGIIPFNFDKEKAKEYYKKGVKKKYFLPNAFKKSPNLDKITGTYVPCFSFDADTDSTYNGRLRIQETRTNNGQTQTYTRYKNIAGERSYNFENVIIESSKLTNQDSFDQIKPFLFDSTTIYEYSEDFLRGYVVESYDNNLKNCKILSENYINSQIRERILSAYHYSSVDYLDVRTKFSNYKYSYVLLPVYFIEFKYKNKDYKTYINGQTGKVGDDLPKSKVKIFFSVFAVILFIALVFGLFFFLK